MVTMQNQKYEFNDKTIEILLACRSLIDDCSAYKKQVRSQLQVTDPIGMQTQFAIAAYQRDQALRNYGFTSVDEFLDFDWQMEMMSTLDCCKFTFVCDGCPNDKEPMCVKAYGVNACYGKGVTDEFICKSLLRTLHTVMRIAPDYSKIDYVDRQNIPVNADVETHVGAENAPLRIGSKFKLSACPGEKGSWVELKKIPQITVWGSHVK